MNVEIMISFRRQRRRNKSGWYPPQKPKGSKTKSPR